MRIAICDDNKITAVYVEEYIASLPLKNITYDVFHSGEDLIKYIQHTHTLYNIYFMDIEMPGRNGIETSSFIREIDKNGLIIFITNHQDYVFQVFDVLPFRFIIKPLTKEKLDTLLGEAIEHIKTMKQIFFFKQGNAQYQVPFDEILYFEGNKRKVKVVTTQSEYEFYDKLSNVKERINQNLFLQIHTSYLVNMDKIQMIHENEILLNNQIILPISKKFKKEAKELHLKYMEWKCGK